MSSDPHPSGRTPRVGDIVMYTPRDVGVPCPSIVVLVASDETLGLRVFVPDKTNPKFVDHRRFDSEKSFATWHWREGDV